MDFRLSKAERICSVSDIERLVTRGRYLNTGIIRCCYCKRCDKSEDSVCDTADSTGGEGRSLNRIMVSVPKKLFRRAVKRNLLKRRIREAYRLQKHMLDGMQGVDMMFVYNTKEAAEFRDIYAAVGSALSRIAGHGKHCGQ